VGKAITQYDQNFEMANKFFENVTRVQAFGNDNNGTILMEKSRLISGKYSYCSFPNISSSRLVSKNLTVKIIIILSAVLYGCKTWPVTHTC
jgi:hypothetical protein